jgi:hypothetical protein
MKETHNAPCALCDSPAIYTENDHGNDRYFSCQSCGKYVITVGAAEYLQTAPDRRRELARRASELSQAGELMLEIRLNPAATGGLSVEAIPRASNPL